MNRLDALMALLVVTGLVVLAPAVLAGPETSDGDVVTVTPAPVPTDRPTAPPTPAYEDPGYSRELGGYGDELGGDPAGDVGGLPDHTIPGTGEVGGATYSGDDGCEVPELSSTSWRRGLLDQEVLCHA